MDRLNEQRLMRWRMRRAEYQDSQSRLLREGEISALVPTFEAAVAVSIAEATPGMYPGYTEIRLL